ncbi:unnamed protein product [Rotaria sordida]|uniref:Poly [ADP-ribose] polymerase n=1 Tax=Rotaria sordida TaxID=392033 RepID=A0A813U0M7_9BILA|nr:unnamed protein product [Rotaria sordida]
MASESNDEINLKQCLELLIIIISDTIDNIKQQINQSNEKQLINNLQIQIKNLLIDNLLSLSFQSRNYLFDILNQYNYNIEEKIFSIELTKNILPSFIYNLQGRLFLIDACQAAWYGDELIVKDFIEKYSLFKNKSGLYGTTLLYSAARNNHLNLVKYLIEIGKCSINIKNEDYNDKNHETKIKAIIGSTPLHAACFNGHIDIVKYLIEHGADYFILNNLYETPIQNGQLRTNIRKFFEDFLLFGYSKKLDILPNKTIIEEIKQNNDIIDCIWEYKIFSHHQWLPISLELSYQLQQSLIINSNKKFQTDIILKISTDIYHISLAQFLYSTINNDQTKNFIWIRCRGSSLFNFHCYSQWQIMFIQHPTGIINNSSSIQIFNMTTTTTNIQLNSWYNCNTKINFLFETAMNYRQKNIIINLDFINNEQIIFDLENFTFNNQQNTIKGFLRWIPKIILNDNSKLIPVDNFQLSTNLDLILLNISYIKQAQLNGIISIDEINQYELKYENIFDNEILNFSNKQSTNEKDSKNLINIIQGNIINEQSDVIVICTLSKNLIESIFTVYGKSLQNLLEMKIKENLNNSIISITTDGKLPSKVIYFVLWKPNSNPDILCQSIQQLVFNVIEKAINENYKSITFPAIGCGEYGCSIRLIAETFIKQVHEQLIKYPIKISFVIQPDRTDIYNEFCKQFNSFQQQEQISITKSISLIIEKGKIEIEQGDIIKQNVDVIIASSSSEDLTQILMKAGGDEVEIAYYQAYINNPNSLIISTPSGQLPCKRIFFIKWEPNRDPELLQQSVIDLIWNVIQNVISYNYNSIAFPALGCGKHACSIDIIIKTMIREMKKEIQMRKLSWLVKFIIEPNHQNIYDEFCKQLLSSNESYHASIDYQLPLTWEKSKENKLRFILSKNTDEYKSISNNFDQAMKEKYTKIIKIERIQNERWFMQYIAHWTDFKKRLNKDTEKRLYHGCSEEAANSIIEDCFNRSFAGVNGTTYGIGVYFSSSAAYSHEFTRLNSNQERCMFLARVLIGKTTLGNKSMKTRPFGFDSTTDGHHIFVTYHDAQAYAEYLITYK